MTPLCDFCREQVEGETIFEAPAAAAHVCERCVRRAAKYLETACAET